MMTNILEIAGQDYANAQSFQKRIEALKRMTGEQRLALAFEMWRIACQLTRDGIRAQFPNYSDAQVNQELARRIMIANGSDRIISTHYQNSPRN